MKPDELKELEKMYTEIQEELSRIISNDFVGELGAEISSFVYDLESALILASIERMYNVKASRHLEAVLKQHLLKRKSFNEFLATIGPLVRRDL